MNLIQCCREEKCQQRRQQITEETKRVEIGSIQTQASGFEQFLPAHGAFTATDKTIPGVNEHFNLTTYNHQHQSPITPIQLQLVRQQLNLMQSSSSVTVSQMTPRLFQLFRQQFNLMTCHY